MLSKAINLIGSFASILSTFSESVSVALSHALNSKTLPILVTAVALIVLLFRRSLGSWYYTTSLKAKILDILKESGELSIDELRDRLHHKDHDLLEPSLRTLLDDRRLQVARRSVSLSSGGNHSVTFYDIWGR
jgi:hypothetical protein